MIAVEAHPQGTIVPVTAHPGSKRRGVLGERAGSIRLGVAEPPEKGKANQAIGALLAELLDVRSSQIRLLSGQTSKSKRFLIEGLEPEAARARLDRALPSASS